MKIYAFRGTRLPYALYLELRHKASKETNS